ncbi:MAG: hypothetical protein ACRD2W_22990, partial [Acidimicrobiales bacterium]
MRDHLLGDPACVPAEAIWVHGNYAVEPASDLPARDDSRVARARPIPGPVPVPLGPIAELLFELGFGPLGTHEQGRPPWGRRHCGRGSLGSIELLPRARRSESTQRGSSGRPSQRRRRTPGPEGGTHGQGRERCCGLDVHKDTVVACVRTPGEGGRRHQEVRTFGTTTAQLLA